MLASFSVHMTLTLAQHRLALSLDSPRALICLCRCHFRYYCIAISDECCGLFIHSSDETYSFMLFTLLGALMVGCWCRETTFPYLPCHFMCSKDTKVNISVYENLESLFWICIWRWCLWLVRLRQVETHWFDISHGLQFKPRIDKDEIAILNCCLLDCLQ